MADSAFTIDLRTRVIPSNARIWALYPGLGKRYLGVFLERSVVFLDLPALSLSVGFSKIERIFGDTLPCLKQLRVGTPEVVAAHFRAETRTATLPAAGNSSPPFRMLNIFLKTYKLAT